MNILYITNHLNAGGITSYVLSLAGGLKEKGHNVYLASRGGELLPKFVESGIIFLPIPIKTKSELSPRILFSRAKLAPVLREKGIDIIHSHSRTTQVLAHLLSRNSSVRHVFTCHGFFKRRLFRQLFPCWGSKVIAISQQVREHLIQDFRLDAKKIIVIHNGIDLNRFAQGPGEDKAVFKRRLGLNGGPVVGIVARLSDVKGHTYLIQAMKSVLGKFPDAQLLIVGEGKMHQGLVALSRKLGIAQHVFFIPTINHTSRALRAMDLFVMPSLKEGLGLALMEAMASGLAVVGSNVGGIKSLIRDQDNGLLVEPADAAQLSEAIISLLGDLKLMSCLGAKARIFINENFSKDKMVLETERVYLRCLEETG
ncbi:glycosyltransferase family 1 protein [bacterium]|nr:MAG: glycosyltransferase family 1 protein [bacterium]